MSKITRYAGNLRAFGSEAQGVERTLFGETTQADDLTSQITSAFLRGWGIVGPSEHPSLEDFNAAMYAMSQFIAYEHQMGVPEWHAEQEYYIGSICTHNGESYQSLENANVGNEPPSAKWTPVLTSRNGLTNLGIKELMIGWNQVWTVFSTGRQTGVTYTNSTGKPIQISVSLIVNATDAQASLYINGVSTASVACSGFPTGQSTRSQLTAIIPSGSTYLITSGTVMQWGELR